MSVIYRTAGIFVRPFAKGVLEKAIADPAAFMERAKKMQQKPLPLKRLHRKYDFEERRTGGTAYYVIRSRKKTGNGIIVYFFGGGYCLPGDSGDFEFGQDMADQTGMDVWLVWYPLFPDTTGYDIAEAAVSVYEEALKESPAKDISFYGNSSGGALCLAACVFLRKYRPDLPLPGKIAASSPSLRVPPTEEEQKKMNRQDASDVMIPAGLMNMYNDHPEIFKTGGFEEFGSPIEQSWKGFPEMLVLFGTDEVFLAYFDSVRKKAAQEKADLQIYVGSGCHCFPAAGFLPEAKPGRKRIYDFLKE